MGLDMYLHKRHDTRNYSPKQPDQYRVRVSVNGNARTDIKPKRVVTVTEQVAKWRKANAIHNWFDRNVADGEYENCGDLFVEREQLQALRDTVRRVRADHSLAPELLPTCDGFFFGSLDYDEYYFDDLAYTEDALTELLAEPYEHLDMDFIYSAWW